MASTENEAVKRLRELSECCICLTTYTDPRMLPCFHSGCLKCFEDIQLKNGKKPGDVLPCPLCRNEFPIPPNGMKGLQKNVFIENLMEVTRAFNAETNSRPCTEEEIRNLYPTRKCVRHSDKVLDYYCSDCKTVVCVSCFVEDHKTHECKDVRTADKKFRQSIEQSFSSMYAHKEKMLSRKLQLATKKEDLFTKAAKIKMVIRKKNQQLKALIDQHTEEVLNEVSLLKQQQDNILEAEIEEIERTLAILESFVTYCNELKSKGSPSEVCSSADKLLTRAKELSKANGECLKRQIRSIEFDFSARDHNSLFQNAGNIIGQLSESTKGNRASNSFAVVFGRGSLLSTSMDAIKVNLNRPENVTFLEPLPAIIQSGAAAAAATVYRNSIFICGLGNRCEEVWKLDSASSKWNKCASMTEGRQLHSAAFVDHVLYICGGMAYWFGEKLDGVEAFNTVGNTCSKVGKLAYAVYGSGNCVPCKASLYIFGGKDANEKVVSNVQVYDTKLNTCTLLTKQMPRACASLRGELWENCVILLGNDGFFLYDIDTQSWTVRDRFKSDNVYSGAIVNEGKLFVIGSSGVQNADVKWIPAANFLNNELTEWIHHAKLPISYPENIFALQS